MAALEIMPMSTEEETHKAATKKDSTKWLRKTKLCVYSVQGACRLGSRCYFAHAVGEVQAAPDLHKTQMCEAFEQGRCSNQNCAFAHGEEELRISPNFKNKLCTWFANSQCRNGAQCGFAHGQEQLRSQPMPQIAAITPPPGLSLEEEVHTKTVLDLAGSILDSTEEVHTKTVLDLTGSILDSTAPPSVEQQVEGMSATIAALQAKIDEMAARAHVSGMKQYLGQLSDQCALLEAQLSPPAPPPADILAKAPWKKTFLAKTPLKTKLSGSATPFQPSSMSIQAQPFVPNFDGYQSYMPTSYDACCDSYWNSDESTDVGSGAETGGFSSD